MQTTETKAWSTAVERIGQEYSLTKLSFEKGSIPLDLNGSIYFNGPAQLERNGQKVGHWFDGDGAVLGIHFHQGTAQGVYRYVQTQAYQEETKANRFLYGNYGSPPPPPFWNRILRPIKETANTSVLALPNKLLALQEGSWPYALDLMTLETMGKDDLGGLNSFYSAHPKRDALTQDIYNFGLSLGLTTTLHLYRQDKNGKILKTQQFSLKKIPLIHDFCLAGNYLVFLISPVYCDLWPVFGQGKSFSDALRWHPEKGTQILIFNRDLELVSQGEATAFFQWHYGNGWVDEKELIHLDLVQYDDFYQTNEHLKEIPTGKTTIPAKGTLWQLVLDPKNGQMVDKICLLDRCCEFPQTNPQNVSRQHQSLYICLHQPETDPVQERYNGLACYHYPTQQVQETHFDPQWYPSEPLIIPKKEALGTWVISVIYNGNTQQSQVFILDGDCLEAEPIAIVNLPCFMPLAFHGTWQSH